MRLGAFEVTHPFHGTPWFATQGSCTGFAKVPPHTVNGNKSKLLRPGRPDSPLCPNAVETLKTVDNSAPPLGLLRSPLVG
jgi:hypothetical protein